MPRWSLLALLLAARPALAADVFGDPSDYRAKVAALAPGDRLLLMPGTYRDCLSIDGLHGRPGAEIVITGPELPGATARFVGGPCVNREPPRASVMIRLQDASHLVIRNLELDGEGLGVVGLQAGYGTTPVHSITVENLHVHDNGTSSQITGISCFATAWDWKIRNNRLEDVGLGLYLGNSDGADPFIRGIVEHNVVLDPRGYAMQIKHQIPRVNVPGMPTGDSVTVIRHNVFMKSRDSATGNLARPNLLVGHFPDTGAGANDRYEIYGNFLFQNDGGGEALFQGEGHVAFHDNVLVNSFPGPGIWIAPHNGVPKEIAIYRNTVLTQDTGITVMGGDGRFRQRVLGNAVFTAAAMPILATDAEGNVAGALGDAARVFADPTPALGSLDLYPRPGQLAGPALDYSAYAAHLDANLDFNGHPNDGRFRGAYAGEGANPGWRLDADRKPRPGALPTPDAGFADASAVDAGRFDFGVEDRGAQVSPPDAAALDAGAADAADAGAREAGAAPGPRRGIEGGDCGCRASRREGSWAFGLALLIGARRARRRSRGGAAGPCGAAT